MTQLAAFPRMTKTSVSLTKTVTLAAQKATEKVKAGVAGNVAHDLPSVCWGDVRRWVPAFAGMTKMVDGDTDVSP